ncbi:MAG: hypothetical protein A4E63_00583 [Syntrophorhabdus sp. PtaU1.Bin050]|nr:MAG: hypothetical protein A4E63_00583 [Syntrophorhabdus sp. PtaU1.Bin050]
MKPSFKFIFIVSLFLSVVLSIVLSVVLPIVMIGFVNWPIFLEGFVVSFMLSLVLSLVIPANLWGDKLAAALGAKPFSFPAHMISTAVVTLVLATLMSLAMVFYFLPAEARPFFIFSWLKAYPWVLLTIYVSALIFAPVGVAIAKKCCGAPSMAERGA